MIVTAMIVTLIVVTAMLVTALTFEFLREVLHESFVCTCSADSFLRMSRTKASFSHAQLSVFEGCLAQKLPFHKLNFKVLKEVSHEMRACCDIFFGGFFRFWRVSFSFTNPFKKASTSYFFSALVPRSGFWSRFWPGCKLHWSGCCIKVALRCSCARSSMVFCSSMLANHIGVAASLSLYVAVAHVVSWSFATCCLQMALDWLRQSCDDWRLMDFLVFGCFWCFPFSS